MPRVSELQKSREAAYKPKRIGSLNQGSQRDPNMGVSEIGVPYLGGPYNRGILLFRVLY